MNVQKQSIEDIHTQYKTGYISLSFFMCELACQCFDGISDQDCLQWFVDQGYFDSTEEALNYYDEN